MISFYRKVFTKKDFTYRPTMVESHIMSTLFIIIILLCYCCMHIANDSCSKYNVAKYSQEIISY